MYSYVSHKICPSPFEFLNTILYANHLMFIYATDYSQLTLCMFMWMYICMDACMLSCM